MTTSETPAWIDEFGNALAESMAGPFLPIHEDADAQLPLRPLRTVQKLNLEDFLSVLNFRARSQQGFLAQLNRISDRLRRWVDEWLDSGRTADGVECPATRNAEVVSAAVDGYSRLGKMRLVGSKNGLQLRFDLKAEKAPSPNASEFAQKMFTETVAGEKFVLFLLSDLSNKLAKCRDCGRYFVLKQVKRTYKTGTPCDECSRLRSETSAKKATADEREDAKKKLHNWAAKRFGSQIVANADWYASPEMKDRIARYLSNQIKRSSVLLKTYPGGISGKWVANAKNWNAIEAIAKKEVH